jgi:hypothetical protein
MDVVDRFALRGLECVCGNMRMAARAVTSIYNRHLREAGLQASQMTQAARRGRFKRAGA